ncbi:uncharacterized protein LOC107884799 [Acyrthosiphon pisum]|uniref:Uncharacterized protein n=1 Tax=Acyrthosiphon pisum TaxID=7029 RepID=A0A8R2D632_ACYPI|nr:uncharacterized protein LOC107884799 [Acyrthosiphon pisum]XP_029343041.1 uncharacterized protein LOC107884799 [Acyrthosiphon pisum]|eukprot:XP_016663162.1 PREDICTED: uncharacterized protein LOC107884799 [Acyrthosiphon pisum]
MTEDCSYCSCSMMAGDSYCSCDRSIVYVLDLATPRFDIGVRQPALPTDVDELSSKKSSSAYKSMMIAAGETNVVANSAVRKRFTASAEALHRSPADHHCGQAPPAPQEQNSRSEEVPSADRDSCSGTDGSDLQATDPQAPDLCTTEFQITDQLQNYNFRATYDPHVANCYANDFFAVITPNASDDFDAVDLTGDDYYRQRSVDFGGWDERAPSDSAQAQSLENGTWGIRVQAAGDAQKEKGSLWTRFKKYISRGLCCQQH